jgi:hypothetical protein
VLQWRSEESESGKGSCCWLTVSGRVRAREQPGNKLRKAAGKGAKQQATRWVQHILGATMGAVRRCNPKILQMVRYEVGKLGTRVQLGAKGKREKDACASIRIEHAGSSIRQVKRSMAAGFPTQLLPNFLGQWTTPICVPQLVLVCRSTFSQVEFGEAGLGKGV